MRSSSGRFTLPNVVGHGAVPNIPRMCSCVASRFETTVEGTFSALRIWKRSTTPLMTKEADLTSRSIGFVLCALALLGGASRAGAQEPRTVTITAKRFQFTPSEVTLKRGETVRLELRSEDVVHGFFMRQLGIDTEIQPGKTTEVVLTPQTAGRFTTICDHFCGSGHGNMKMTIVVE